MANRYGGALLEKLTPAKALGKAGRIARRSLAPGLLRRSPLNGRTFDLWGESYPYFLHPYNQTFLNERCVEIAVAISFLETAEGDGVEIGNVLSHYGVRGNWDIVDRYEKFPGVTNIDIIDYAPARPINFAVSISTFEHVGWDERPREPHKLLKAVDNIVGCLAPGAKALVTAPLCYNPILDEAVVDKRWATEREAVMHKSPEGWHESSARTHLPFPDRARWPQTKAWPRSIWIAELIG